MSSIPTEVLDKSPVIIVISVILFALILVVSMAWNDLFERIINKYFPKNTILASTLYAVTITVILVVLILCLRHLIPDLVKQLSESHNSEGNKLSK